MNRSDGSTALPDIDVAGVARALGIPEKSLSDPVVAEYVGIVARLHQLQLDVSRYPQHSPLLSPRTSSASFPERYYTVDNLLRVAIHILCEGFGWGRIPALKDEPAYLQEKVNKALRPYGLGVRKKRGARRTDTHEARRTPMEAVGG